MAREIVINAVLLKALWLAAVVGAGVYGLVPLVWVAAGALIISKLRLDTCKADLQLAAWLVPVGWLLDTIWVQLGILDFGPSPVAPLWIAMLWLGVALSVHHSLAFLRDRPRFGALFVGVFAPFSYWGGAELGAVTIPSPYGLVAVGVAWAVLFYLLFAQAQRQSDAWVAAQQPSPG